MWIRHKLVEITQPVLEDQIRAAIMTNPAEITVEDVMLCIECDRWFYRESPLIDPIKGHLMLDRY